MATANRLTRAVRTTPFRSAPARATTCLPRQIFRQSTRRCYADAPPNFNDSNTGFNKVFFFSICGATATAIGGFVVYQRTRAPAFTPTTEKAKEIVKSSVGKAAGTFKPELEDYQEVYNEVAALLHDKDDYDDGSYGPVLLRLGWHASGTYDAETKTGGSNGSTMRFAPEADHGANAGLKAARDFLEPVKEKFPWITYSDLWTLASVCSIQEMQGPTIPWRPGRADRDVGFCTPDGRLPDGAKDQSHLRAIFGRMGFNDRETVALSGAHALGRCHSDRSGFDGPWTFSPTVVTNDYYKLLLEEKWAYKKWDGPKQFEDVKTKSLMMLPTDMALVKDKGFKPFVEEYAKDNELFFKDFAAVLTKLFELGVPFQTGEEARMRFKATA